MIWAPSWAKELVDNDDALDPEWVESESESSKGLIPSWLWQFIISEELQLLPIDARMEAGVRCDMVVCVVVLDASN